MGVNENDCRILWKSGQPCGNLLHDTPAEPAVKYPWQQAVSDASTETRSEALPLKVNAAQRAISARLCDKTPAAPEEQIAIREALHSLSALLQETKEESRQEYESGRKRQPRKLIAPSTGCVCRLCPRTETPTACLTLPQRIHIGDVGHSHVSRLISASR
jgi:hypothetical protein